MPYHTEVDKPFLYSMLALRIGRTGIEVVHRAGQVLAPSQEQANALALRLCRLVFAEREGFRHHSVALCNAAATTGEMVSVIALD